MLIYLSGCLISIIMMWNYLKDREELDFSTKFLTIAMFSVTSWFGVFIIVISDKKIKY